ncbi:MAG: DNA integrity scanning diadenylate cyclase DisA [Ferrimicrobium sp.]
MSAVEFQCALEKVAPGTPLRAGLDRILLAKAGVLVVLGDPPELLELCSGGFLIEAGYSPQKLFELAKMDGAIVLSAGLSRVVRANVHLVPDPRLPTTETGTRHRTAERVAESVGVTVVAVSEELSVITVYHGSMKRTLQPIPALLSRANQALSTLERYRGRLDTVLSTLDVLELSEHVTYRDVLFVLQRAEMVRRIREEIDGYLVELGSDGRLLALQVTEVSLGFNREYSNVICDFLGLQDDEEVDGLKRLLSDCASDSLMDVGELGRLVADKTGFGALVDAETQDEELLDVRLSSRGRRLILHIPRLPREVASALVEQIGSLATLMSCEEQSLASLPAVGPEWAKVVKDYLRSLG